MEEFSSRCNTSSDIWNKMKSDDEKFLFLVLLLVLHLMSYSVTNALRGSVWVLVSAMSRSLGNFYDFN